jgi:hypothetical protein
MSKRPAWCTSLTDEEWERLWTATVEQIEADLDHEFEQVEAALKEIIAEEEGVHEEQGPRSAS